MASDSPGDTSVSVSLPESLRRWLDDKASEEGRSREDVLLQLLSAYRKVDGLEDGAVDLPSGMAPDDGLPAALEEELQQRVDERVETLADDGVDHGELDQRLSTIESQFKELLEDVRDRVIQVKREADEKAPADHDHPALVSEEALAALDDDVGTVTTALDSLEARMETGFENFEEVLESLANDIDRVSARQTTLARAVLETREELRKLAARDTARSAAEALTRDANKQGVRSADCGECGSSVAVGLLTRAECPHCSAPFVGVEPAQGFFGSDTIATGERPALEAGDEGEGAFEHEVDEIIDGDESARVGVQDELDSEDAE
jgi:predicted Zn-ribbon and HTH transcriptional regulator